MTIEVVSRKVALLLRFTRWFWFNTTTSCSRLQTPNDLVRFTCWFRFITTTRCSRLQTSNNLLRLLDQYLFLCSCWEFGQIKTKHDILSGKSSFFREESNADRTDSSASSTREFLIFSAFLLVFLDGHRSLSRVHYSHQSRIDKPAESQMYLRRCDSCQTETKAAVCLLPSLFPSETINTGIGEPLHSYSQPQNTPCLETIDEKSSSPFPISPCTSTRNQSQ